MAPWLIGDLGTPEIVIILAVIMLVFGGSKLPGACPGERQGSADLQGRGRRT